MNDLVLLKVPDLSNASQKVISKFFNIYEGPYKITRLIGKNAFEITNPSMPTVIKGVYNRFNLRKYHVVPNFSL